MSDEKDPKWLDDGQGFRAGTVEGTPERLAKLGYEDEGSTWQMAAMHGRAPSPDPDAAFSAQVEALMAECHRHGYYHPAGSKPIAAAREAVLSSHRREVDAAVMEGERRIDEMERERDEARAERDRYKNERDRARDRASYECREKEKSQSDLDAARSALLRVEALVGTWREHVSGGASPAWKACLEQLEAALARAADPATKSNEEGK